MAVAPGFIDVHAHDDAAVVRDPSVDFKIMQGVTTDVVGNCGAGVAPANAAFREAYARNFSAILGESDLPWTTFADYTDAVDAAHPACNVAAYIPHGVVRFNVMGAEKRDPSSEELDEMRALVEEAMRAGAIGLSTGLIYPPGAYAKTGEIVELAKVAAKFGGIYTSHIRNESKGCSMPWRKRSNRRALGLRGTAFTPQGRWPWCARPHEDLAAGDGGHPRPRR